MFLVFFRLCAVLFCSVSIGWAEAPLWEERQDYVRPTEIPFPEFAPYNREIAMLGKMLFFDPRISTSQNMSCASCHNPSFGWEAPVARAIGAMNTPLRRHAPTILNSAWSDTFFWDGRTDTLEEQAAGPITAKMEMNATFDGIIKRLSASEEYSALFERLFPQKGISRASIVQSLATYERTVVTQPGPFDRWVSGQESAISEQAKRGFEFFIGTAGCSACHSGWRFTDQQFYDLGTDLYPQGSQQDQTRPKGTQRPIKVPTLRNISLRAPYMHLGNIDTLEDVIAAYAEGGPQHEDSISLDIFPFEASPRDIADLLAFLKTLTEDGTGVKSPILPAN